MVTLTIEQEDESVYVGLPAELVGTKCVIPVVSWLAARGIAEAICANIEERDVYLDDRVTGQRQRLVCDPVSGQPGFEVVGA